jgi:NADP-dependent 3-hydroxy acid dehydrogenase YdfG
VVGEIRQGGCKRPLVSNSITAYSCPMLNFLRPRPTCPQKTVWITGASSGIGKSLAREFANRGATVVLTGRRLDRLTSLAQEILAQGKQAVALELDVTEDGQCERVVAEILRTYGRLDVVIANAGFGVVGNVESLTLNDYRRQLETNLYGVLRKGEAGMAKEVVLTAAACKGHPSARKRTVFAF